MKYNTLTIDNMLFELGSLEAVAEKINISVDEVIDILQPPVDINRAKFLASFNSNSSVEPEYFAGFSSSEIKRSIDAGIQKEHRAAMEDNAFFKDNFQTYENKPVPLHFEVIRNKEYAPGEDCPVCIMDKKEFKTLYNSLQPFINAADREFINKRGRSVEDYIHDDFIRIALQGIGIKGRTIHIISRKQWAANR